MQQYRVPSVVGDWIVELQGDSLRRIHVPEEGTPTNLPELRGKIRDAMDRMLKGQNLVWGEIPKGTTFQTQVWQAMTKIPPGAVKSYGEIALEIGRPGAARAVGAACKSNPYPLLIPCHRVIAGSGALGGYMGMRGIEVKRVLLQNEGWSGVKGANVG